MDSTKPEQPNAAQVIPQQQAQEELEDFMIEANANFTTHNGFW